MLDEMLRPCKHLKIRDVVIHYVTIFMMDNMTLRKWPINGLPYDLRPQSPSIRFRDLLIGSHRSMIHTDADGTNRNPINSVLTFTKLSFRRKVYAFHVFIPRVMSFFKLSFSHNIIVADYWLRYKDYFDAQEARFANHIAQPKLFTPEPQAMTQATLI